MILNKRIKRTIMENKSRYFGALFLIALSSMILVSFSLCGINIKESVYEFRESKRVEDGNFMVQKPITNIETIEEKYNIEIELNKNIDFKYSNDTTLRIFRETKKINLYEVVKGKGLSGDNDILINNKFGESKDINIGDFIEINDIKYNVSGYFTIPNYLYILKSENDFLPDYDGFGIAVVNENFFKNNNSYTSLYSVKFKDNNIDEVKKYINEEYLVTKWTDNEDNGRIVTFNGDIEAFIKMGEILPVAVMLITCVFVVVIIWRQLKQEFALIGTFYAIGLNKKEILFHYLIYSIVISIFGSLIGTSIGLFLVKPLEIVQTIQYNLPVINYDYKIQNILLSLFTPFCCLIPITIYVVLKALSLPPLVLIRGGAEKVKVGFVEKIVKLNMFKFVTKFKIREILRNPIRTILMVLGVTFSSMLLLFGFVTNDSIKGIIDESYKNVYQYENMYILNSVKFDNNINGDKISIWPFTEKKSEKVFNVFAIEKNSKLVILKDKNDKLIEMDKVTITKALAENLKVKENDIIEIENKLSFEKIKLKIDKITKAQTGDYIYIPLDKYNNIFSIPKGGYTGILSKEEININVNELNTHVKKAEFIEAFEEMLNPLKYMLLIFGIAAGIIGMIIIYVVTSMIIEENRINISLFKILGYSKKKIFNIILNTNTILFIVGYIIAVPIIIKTTSEFFEIITSEMSMDISAKLNGINILIGFAVVFSIYLISKTIVKNKILNISMVEVLKSKSE